MKVVCFQISNGLIIQSSDYLDGTCVSRFNLKIHLDFSYEALHCGIKCTINPLSRNRIHTLKKWSTIQEAIRYLNAMEIDNKKDVLRQQMNSMKACCVGEKKYELNTIIRADFLFEQSNIIINQVRNLNGNIVSIICDGNRTNQSFFTKFNRVSPWLTSENIFLLFDYVHLM